MMLGNNIRIARKRMGLTQDATSGFAGVYLARQGIYTLFPETALLLRNKSKAKEL